MKNRKTHAVGAISVVLAVTLYSGGLGFAAMAKQPDSKESAGDPPEGMPRGHFPGSVGDGFRPPPPDGMHRGEPRRRQGRRGGEKISKQERMQLKQFIEEHFPKMHEELQRLQDRNPERAKKRMAHMAPGFLHMMKTMERDPEQGSLMIRERRLDMRLRRSGHQYRQATDDAGRDKLEAEIRELCAEAFDCRQALREMGVRSLEARVAELRDRHREATSMREQLIDRAVRDHLEGPPGRGRDRAGMPERLFGKP